MATQQASTQDWDKVVRTVCSPNCTGTCGVNAYVRNDRIIKLEPASYPDPRYERICLKGISMALERIHATNRLTHPLRRTGPRGANQWEQVSWDEALGDIASRLRSTADLHGATANAWVSMTGNSGLKALLAPIRVANALGGTTFSNVGLMGDGACGMGLATVLGTMFSGQRYEDLKGSKLVIMLAKNIADTAHSEMHFLFDAMETGTRMIAIDPRFSRTASKADQWIAPRAGTDGAMLIGMMNVILDEGLHDAAYLGRHTNAPFLVRTDTRAMLRAGDVFGGEDTAYLVWGPGDLPTPAENVSEPPLHGEREVTLADGTTVRCRTAFDASVAAWRALPLDQAAEICGLEPDVIRALAVEYAVTNPATIILGQGAQRYFNGHQTFRGAYILGALCGKIGQPHGGVHWADGPLLQLLYAMPPTSDWISPGGRMGGMLPGTRMIETIAGGQPYPVKSLWITNYGFSTQSGIFRRFVDEALPQLDLFVVTEQVMTPAARHADYVLPCVSYYEEELDIVGGAEHWSVQMRQRAVQPVGASRSDWEIFADLCTRMGQGAPWALDAEETCRRLIAEHPDPRFSSIDYEKLRREGVVMVDMPKPYVPWADQKFPTPSGRFELYAEQLAGVDQEVLTYVPPIEGRGHSRADKYPLTLITNHQVHTTHSQHVNLSLIREHIPEPRMDMNIADAADRGIADCEVVRVFNDRGHFKVTVNVTEAIRQGTVSIPQGWWPEHFIDGSYTDVLHMPINPAQDAILETNYAIYDTAVQVQRAPNG